MESPETQVNKGVQRKRNNLAGSDSGVPILGKESELFGARLADVIGKESVRSFASRCGLSDRLVSAYAKGQKEPGLVNLLALARAGGVLIDWLATGRGPKTRAERDSAPHGAAQEPAVYNREGIDRARLRLALVMADDAARLVTEPVTPERRADLALAFYDRLGAPNDKP